jgi:hypothetical protein
MQLTEVTTLCSMPQHEYLPRKFGRTDGSFPNWSGNKDALLHPRPLRTVHASSVSQHTAQALIRQ